jgi:hypothetical protein
MKCATSSARCSCLTSIFTFFAVIFVTAWTTSCGSSGSSGSKTPTPQQFSGNTNVTVMASSTANDQLSQFQLQIQTLTLTSQSGSPVNVLSGSWPTEFIHVNGAIEPVATVTVPQGIYTAASAVIGGASFTCLTVMPAGSDSPGSLDTSIYAYGYTPNAQVTVNLPSPITITGDNMGLVLNLQVSQSATYPNTCYPPDGGIATFSITPTFNLAPATFSSQATSPASGKITELEGQMSALGTDGKSFTLAVSGPNSGFNQLLTIISNDNTVYQGISNFSALQVGTFVDMDGAIQPDGSVLATRIASYDQTALNVMIGPLLQLPVSEPNFFSFPSEQQGQTYSEPLQSQSLGVYSYSGSTSFQISGEMSNVNSLPFVASFSSSNMVTGQNVAIFSGQISDYYGGEYTPATTLTLMPQTIDATVVGAATSGSFTDYTVLLAAYDLFPTLAMQPGQTTLLTNPSQIEVYVDSNTQQINTQALAVGSTLRFYGLVFNDNGTLRMDCAQVNDGVAFTPPSNSNSQAFTSSARTVRRQAPGGLPILTTSTASR